MASFHQGIGNSGSWLQFSPDGTSSTWQAGMSSDNSYVSGASDATNVLSVDQSGDTTMSGNLDVGKVSTLKRTPGVSDTHPLNIINESPGGATGISYQSTASGQGCLIAYATAQSAAGSTEGVNWGSSNEFIIKSGSNGLTIQSNGDTTISGTLGVQRLSITNTSARAIEFNNTMHNGPYPVAVSQNYSNDNKSFALRCRPLNQLWRFGVTTSGQYSISHEKSTKFSIQPNGNTTTSGNLDVGPSQAQTSIKAYVNHAGSQGNIQIEARWRSESFIHF